MNNRTSLSIAGIRKDDKEMTTFLHSGDFGDIIAALASVKAMGGGTIVLDDRPPTRPIIPRAHLITPLLLSQRYVFNVVVGSPQPEPTHDFSTFRQGGMKYGTTLARLQADWIGADPDISKPWITDIDPDPNTEGCTIINRTARYHNPLIQWREILPSLERPMFIGTPEEHSQFLQVACRNVPYYPTKDLLDVARAIKGSTLFMGNQSSAYNIAEAMKHPRALEVCLHALDCCYPGPNKTFILDGSFRDIPPYLPPGSMDTTKTPQGGWEATIDGSIHRNRHLLPLAYQISRTLACDTHFAMNVIVQQTIKKFPHLYQAPEWFKETTQKLNLIRQIIQDL